MSCVTRWTIAILGYDVNGAIENEFNGARAEFSVALTVHFNVHDALAPAQLPESDVSITPARARGPSAQRASRHAVTKSP